MGEAPMSNENRLGPKAPRRRVEDILSPGDVDSGAARPARKAGSSPWFSCPASRGRWWRSIRTTARSSRWPAASTSIRSKFNRVTQAHRQPGSSFKPFIYSAAVERRIHGRDAGASTMRRWSSTIRGSRTTWRPENYSGKFFGPTRLRQALYKSRNLVSIRICSRSRSASSNALERTRAAFGFDVERLPRDLSLALGSGAVTRRWSWPGATRCWPTAGSWSSRTSSAAVEASDGTVWYDVIEPAWVCRDCESAAARPRGSRRTARMPQ